MWPPGHHTSISSDLPNSSNIVQVSILLPDQWVFNKVEPFLAPSQKRSGVGVLVGFQTAYRLGILRSDLFFNITFRDSKCDGTYGSKSFLDAFVEGVHVLFGPSCEYSLGKLFLFLLYVNLYAKYSINDLLNALITMAFSRCL